MISDPSARVRRVLHGRLVFDSRHRSGFSRRTTRPSRDRRGARGSERRRHAFTGSPGVGPRPSRRAPVSREKNTGRTWTDDRRTGRPGAASRTSYGCVVTLSFGASTRCVYTITDVVRPYEAVLHERRRRRRRS